MKIKNVILVDTPYFQALYHFGKLYDWAPNNAGGIDWVPLLSGSDLIHISTHYMYVSPPIELMGRSPYRNISEYGNGLIPWKE